MNKETIKTVLINEIASELKVASTDVDEYASFTRMGVSSVQALNINPVPLFEFNTVDDISTYLAEEFA